MLGTLASFLIRRWQLTVVGLAFFVMAGLNAFISIPRSEDPIFPVPDVAIRIVAPGQDPASVEQYIVRPIEAAIGDLDDVDTINSVSADGAGAVGVRFAWGVDGERKLDEVLREVNGIRSALPDQVDLDIQRTRITNVAIAQVALVSDVASAKELGLLAQRLSERLDRVPGVRQSRVWGGPAAEITVALDFARMAQLRLAPTAVAEALAGAGAQAPLGAVTAGARRFNLKSSESFRSIDSIRNVAVATDGGRVVKVGDVAAVSWGEGELVHAARFNGRRAVFVTVTQKDADDVGRVTQRVINELTAFEARLPAGVSLGRGFLQADNTSRRLNRLYRDFAIATILVLLTLLPLGIRAGLIVMISIPISIMGALVLLDAFGFTLNQLSIAGLILSLGLVVDDSIVVVENIVRHVRQGALPLVAAVEGTRQIGLAVIGCTMTLLFAFLPLMTLPSASGAYIQSLPVAVACAVIASLLVALVIVPFLASTVLGSARAQGTSRMLAWFESSIHRIYAPTLERALDRPWLSLAVLLALCLLAFPMVNAMGTSLFPKAETPSFLVRIAAPPGAGLARTEDSLRFVEETLRRHPEIVWSYGNLGRGNPQIFYNQPQRTASASYAEVFAGLHEWVPGKSDRLVESLRSRFDSYPGARIEVVTFANGPPVDAPVAVRISGENLATLRRLSQGAAAALRATPGLRDVHDPLADERLDLDLGLFRDKALILKVPPGAAERTIRLALSGETVARFQDADGEQFPVMLRLARADPRSNPALEAALGLYVPTATGAAVPLSAIAAPRLLTGPARIDRYDRVRTVTVTAQVEEGVSVAKATQQGLARVRASVALPPGYGFSLGGEDEARSEGFAGLSFAVLVSLFGILALLLIEFRRFRTALAVAGIIPFGIFGAVAALWLCGETLSFTAAIGIVALIGIEVKNSILLVDFSEQLVLAGRPIRKAIETAAEVRFLPIMLTSVTAICGLIPLAIEGSGLYSPLAIAIIGGLVSSTLLSRIATPVMYWLAARNRAVGTI